MSDCSSSFLFMSEASIDSNHHISAERWLAAVSDVGYLKRNGKIFVLDNEFSEGEIFQLENQWWLFGYCVTWGQLSFEAYDGHVVCRRFFFFYGCFYAADVAAHMARCIRGAASVWIHAGVRTCMAGESLLPMQQPRSSACTGRYMHIRTRTVYTWSVRAGGRRKTTFHKTGEWTARSGYAMLDVISSNLQPRSEHTSQACCVEKAFHIAVFIIIYLTTDE